MRQRRFRRFTAACLLLSASLSWAGLSCAVFAWMPAAWAQAPGAPLDLQTYGERLNPEVPDQLRLGGLAWRGGLRLSSPHPDFGGLSGLLIAEDGSRLLAVTDRGSWVTARPVYDAAGYLTGLEAARIGPLLDLDGRPVADTPQGNDAEALAWLPNGEVLVSFERKHRLLRYALVESAPAGLPQPFATPPGHAPGSNEGLEGLAELPNGILAVSEGLTGSDAAGTTSSGFLWDGEAWQATALRRRDLLAPVGAAPLPDGSGVLLLERHWSPIGGIRVRLLRLDAADIVPGGVATSQELAFFQPPLIADNFEGVASRRTPQGETLVYLVSDDNFNVLQRSLLLMFAIVE